MFDLGFFFLLLFFFGGGGGCYWTDRTGSLCLDTGTKHEILFQNLHLKTLIRTSHSFLKCDKMNGFDPRLSLRDMIILHKMNQPKRYLILG